MVDTNDTIGASMNTLPANQQNHKDDESILTNDDIVSKWLLGDNDVKTIEYVDSRVPLVKRVKSLLQFWNELSGEVTRVREGYSLAIQWEDENLKKKFLGDGTVLMKKLNPIEKDLKDLLPQLKNVTFLRNDELTLLPKWMWDCLEIDYSKVEQK